MTTVLHTGPHTDLASALRFQTQAEIAIHLGALGRAHGFADETHGTLLFDVCHIFDGAHFVPQHRERIMIVGFRKADRISFDWNALPLPANMAILTIFSG